jgi:hypothetical protein
MSKTTLALLTLAALSGACAVDDASRPETDPRDGIYTVHSEVEAESISSEIFQDGVLVAVATLDAEEGVVTSVASGKELAAPRPDDYDPRADLDRYHETVIGVSKGLALSELDLEGDVELRMADECGWFPYVTGSSLCIVSWCGSSCMALDCNGPYGETHWISGCG